MPLTPVMPSRPLRWHPSVEALQAILPPDTEVYLVGGAVRDAYLHLSLHDLDLATPGDGRPLARRIADAFKGAYYPLDSTRGVGRALISWQDQRLTIDVAQLRGPDLLTDLQARDFTINAVAVRLTGQLQAVLDPLGGLQDLEAGWLRQCSTDSIQRDPVRALRAVRASIRFGLQIEANTRLNIRTYAPALTRISAERVRDEFFNILDSHRPATALAVLARLGLLRYVVPEATALSGVEQGLPHQYDVWHHTLATVDHFDRLLRLINGEADENLAANLHAGVIISALDDLIPALRAHLSHTWPNERTHRALLTLAALLHDVGKPSTREVDASGRIRFLRHEQVGAALAQQRAAALRLSAGESARLGTIIAHHMRPHWLEAGKKSPSARATYRFWRDTGPAGVDVCLLALADYLGTHGPALDAGEWTSYANTIRALLEAYFERFETTVAPPPLVKGKQLIARFGLEPGPLIGELLDGIREAQAIGELSTHEEALDWVQRFLEEHRQ